MSAEVLARWETFLAKIRSAFDNLMNEARAGCLELLDLEGLDPTAMTNAWMGVRAEALALSRKAPDTWRETVSDAFVGAGVTREVLNAQEARAYAFERQLDLECEQREIEVFAEAGDKILVAAERLLAQGFRCRNCGAQLAVPQRFFRSVHLACAYCNAANTFEPGSQVRMVEHFCSHRLSQRAALAEWTALKQAEEVHRRARGDPPEVMRSLADATRRYWEKYYRFRAELVPEFAKDLERDIASRTRGTSHASG